MDNNNINFPSQDLIKSAMETSRSLQMEQLLGPQKEFQKQVNDIADQMSKEKEEKRKREIRSLEINEEMLELSKFTNFLLQSVNRDQKEMLDNIKSLIETVYLNDKVKEANMAIIEKELIELKESTNNLNEGFIKLVEMKMVEMGVEAAIKYFFIGIKTLFLSNN
ncbi:hypothetical protein NSA50_17815 [Clostridium sp. DSM 100503]|uniref:hypothetical protein n=1 Tax=Clostridium sp. DSM 100503 TaxID=2963282 RepID=UPI002149FD92|nr:hypothetical protein [Clostridium sp. DSM 100503]MCR1952861.1 hypothetical protein [Clostridium sp. DSM 100503]